MPVIPLATSIDASDAIASLRAELLSRKTKHVVPAPRTVSSAEWPPDYDAVELWRRTTLAKFEADPELVPAAKAFYSNGVDGLIAFINHWCDTHDPRNANTDKLVWMPFILFTRQEELVRFIYSCLVDDQPGLVEKCRTMGATWVCVAISVWLWLFFPGTAIGWGSQDAVSVDQIGNPKSIFFKLRGLIQRLPALFQPEGLVSDHLKQYVCTNPENGSSIVGEVGDKIGRGGRSRVFFEDEAAHYQHPDLIEASLSENTRVPIAVSSVNGPGNLFHRKRESGQDWYPGCDIPKGIVRVFVMDWRDHPEFSQSWYDTKKAQHVAQGTLHVFAQEIERNYNAAVQGTIIPSDWLDACVDAHVKLGIPIEGNKISALDIGDSEDGDRNAQSIRTGSILTFAEEWTARDPGVTARKAMGICIDNGVPELQYDAAGGLGSSVKSEVNRLKDEKAFPSKLTIVPWNAGGKVLQPSERVVPDDRESPKNKDFFMNLKAQAWWSLRMRVFRTYQAVVGELQPDGTYLKVEFNPDDLFCIDSKLPLLHKIKKELCQATISKGSRLKLVVDKSPPGTRSPNIADSIVMAYWPMPKYEEFAMVGMGPKVFVDGNLQ